jgi:ectoine hydroxylase-related dioxygenase (phytanoyl-CoA dioxygenase family)
LPTDQAVFELDIYGFTVLPSVIPEAEAARLCGVLDEADDRIGIEYVYEEAFARSVPCAPALDGGFMALVDNPQTLAVVEQVLGPEIVLGSMNARIVRPGDPDQGMHSDIPLVHRRVTGTPVMLQVVWMLDGFTVEKGATRIVPGSHRHPEAYPPSSMGLPHVLQPVGPPGSAMIFNGQCWHGGGANHSQERRRAVFGHYRLDAWMRFQTDPATYVTREQWRRMTPRQRELMRMTHGHGQKNAADYYADQMRAKRYD